MFVYLSYVCIAQNIHKIDIFSEQMCASDCMHANQNRHTRADTKKIQSSSMQYNALLTPVSVLHRHTFTQRHLRVFDARAPSGAGRDQFVILYNQSRTFYTDAHLPWGVATSLVITCYTFCARRDRRGFLGGARFAVGDLGQSTARASKHRSTLCDVLCCANICQLPAGLPAGVICIFIECSM